MSVCMVATNNFRYGSPAVDVQKSWSIDRALLFQNNEARGILAFSGEDKKWGHPMNRGG